MENYKPRILIVEDDEPTATKYRRALEKLGDSRIAERVDQVYREIIDFDPQLILLDIVLEGEKVYRPMEAGIRILEQIKELRLPFKEIPVIVITALIDPDIEQLCRKKGAEDFYQKPVPLQTLRKAVEKALNDQRSRTQDQISIFISSHMKDLSAERRIVQQAIKELGPQYKPELAEDWAAGPEAPSKIWQRAATECDLFILLLGQEYGNLSLETGISATEDEYNHARAAGKPILVFQKNITGQNCPPEMTAFMARLYDSNNGHVVRVFSTSTQLRAEIQRSIKNIKR